MEKRRRAVLVILSVTLFFIFGIFVVISYTWYQYNKKIAEDIAVVEEIRGKVELIEEDADIDPNLLRRIDFDELMSINPDATRWIYIPDTNVDYYVMQEPEVGKTFYLWKDIHKQKNAWGSILTPKTPEGTVDAHLLIFGHHMRDKTVGFSNLNLYQDASYGEAHPYVYLYYPDRSERWRLFAACDSDKSDKVYEIPYDLGSADYQTLLDSIAGKRLYVMPDTKAPGENTPTVILSTCNGARAGSPIRFYLELVPDDVYYYDKQ